MENVRLPGSDLSIWNLNSASLFGVLFPWLFFFTRYSTFCSWAYFRLRIAREWWVMNMKSNLNQFVILTVVLWLIYFRWCDIYTRFVLQILVIGTSPSPSLLFFSELSPSFLPSLQHSLSLSLSLWRFRVLKLKLRIPTGLSVFPFGSHRVRFISNFF